MTPQAQLCLSKYGDASNFCTLFDKSKVLAYIKEKGEDYMVTNTNAPSLVTIRNAYGDKVAVSLLETYLLKMVEFIGMSDKATPEQINEIANIIITKFHYLKITEIMHCFFLIKAGDIRNKKDEDVSKMYGTFNGQAIMDCFHEYIEKRNAIIDKHAADDRNKKYEDMMNNAASPDEVKEHLSKVLGKGGNSLLESVAVGNGWMSNQEIKDARREHIKHIDENHITEFKPESAEDAEVRRKNTEEFYRKLEAQKREKEHRENLGL